MNAKLAEWINESVKRMNESKREKYIAGRLLGLLMFGMMRRGQDCCNRLCHNYKGCLEAQTMDM